MTSNPSVNNTAARKGWLAALRVYLQPNVLSLFFLGFSAGLPLLLVFGTLSAWLARVGVSKTEIGYFSWVALAYSLKFLWAPVVDRLPVPLLTRRLGKRRSWMLMAQLGIASGLLAISQIDPTQNLLLIALLAVVVAFSSATQDVVIDAYRIEIAPDDLQGAMAANYQLGYRLAMICAGAGALYIAGTFSWPLAYQVMALCVAVGFVTALVIREPDHQSLPALAAINDPEVRAAVARNLLAVAGLFVGIASLVMVLTEQQLLQRIFFAVLVMGAMLALLGLLAWRGRAEKITAWLYPSIVLPFADFFTRNGWKALVILLFITLYRFSDITLGIMANPFYIDIGFSEIQIGEVTKFYGLLMTILGAYVGGLMITRWGIGKPLLLGAVTVVLTNLLFVWLARQGADYNALILTISADNFCGGLAGSASIAYASSLVNRSFSASQYAVFSSLFTLAGKFIGGFSGIVVDGYGYETFFWMASMLGLPAVALALFLMPGIKRAEQSATPH